MARATEVRGYWPGVDASEAERAIEEGLCGEVVGEALWGPKLSQYNGPTPDACSMTAVSDACKQSTYISLCALSSDNCDSPQAAQILLAVAEVQLSPFPSRKGKPLQAASSPGVVATPCQRIRDDLLAYVVRMIARKRE